MLPLEIDHDVLLIRDQLDEAPFSGLFVTIHDHGQFADNGLFIGAGDRFLQGDVSGPGGSQERRTRMPEGFLQIRDRYACGRPHEHRLGKLDVQGNQLFSGRLFGRRRGNLLLWKAACPGAGCTAPAAGGAGCSPGASAAVVGTPPDF